MGPGVLISKETAETVQRQAEPQPSGADAIDAGRPNAVDLTSRPKAFRRFPTGSKHLQPTSPYQQLAPLRLAT